MLNSEDINGTILFLISKKFSLYKWTEYNIDEHGVFDQG